MSKIISIEEVAKHNSEEDFWFILHDKVLDVTEFLLEHPGGQEPLMDWAGKDGTLAFLNVGHSKLATELVEEYIIGKVSEAELSILEKQREEDKIKNESVKTEQKSEGGSCVIM